jgi:hypothetical protein
MNSTTASEAMNSTTASEAMNCDPAPDVTKCATDGYEFTNQPFLAPVSYDQSSDVFTFENIHFCSPSCVKGWLFRDIHRNSARIQLFTLYCKRKLGIDKVVDICPDPRFINEYMIDKSKGLTIREFRSKNDQYALSVAYPHVNPSIDQSVYLQAVPTDHDELDETAYTV